MESGVFWGYVSMIEGMLARAVGGCPCQRRHAGNRHRWTGSLFARHLAGAVTVDQDLTVKGLFAIFARNSRARHDEDNDG